MVHLDGDGEKVVRRLLVPEVVMKFNGRHYKVDSPVPLDHDDAAAWLGNSCNADMFCGNLERLWRHVKPACTFRPTSFDQVRAPGLEQKVLATMQGEQRRLQAVKDGKRPPPRKDLVIEHPVPDPRAQGVNWYLGKANETGNPKDIMTVQEMPRPAAAVNTEWTSKLGLASHDKQIAGMLSDGIHPGNAFQQPLVVCQNHGSALKAWELMTKCMQEENAAGRNRFIRPDLARKDGKLQPIWNCAKSSKTVLDFIPFFATPQGAVPKKLADGAIDPDNCRPTSDFSWPPPSDALAKYVTAPNDLIDKDSLPGFRWFKLSDFFAQVHYLKQWGVPLEMAKWDLERYYRAFRLLGGAMPSHMQLWLDDISPFLVSDWRMAFGGRAAANFASRASLLLSWLVRFAIKHVCPVQLMEADEQPHAVERWQTILDWFAMARQADAAGEKMVELLPAFISFFIDDFPMVSIAGFGRVVLTVFAALLDVLGLDPQMKKVLPEGDFRQQGVVMGVFIDLEAMTASIPPDKVVKAQRLLAPFIDGRQEHKLLDELLIEQLLGLLNWMSEVLVGGRFHLSQIISARRAAAKRSYCVLTTGLHRECMWWHKVLQQWNCVAMIVPPEYMLSPWKWVDSPVTDASRELSTLSGGGGAFYNGMWGLCKWTEEEVRELDIMELEALMCVLWIATLLDINPELLRGRRFVFRNDNQPWYYACNDNDSSKPAIAVLLEWLHSLQSIYSFRMYLDWIPSDENPIADAVSREEWSRFYAVAAANHYHKSDLRCVQVLERSSIVSLMISMKKSAKAMLLPR